MELLFESGGVRLAGSVSRPRARAAGPWPGLVLCHGFPSFGAGGEVLPRTFPELADRIATEMGWVAVAFALRGCGDSEGDFSLGGWLEDVRSAVAFMEHEADVSGVWLAGFGTGGALAICAGALEPAVRGVAALGAPADFDDWASHPRRLLQHAREKGLIRDPSFPSAMDVFARPLREINAVDCAAQLVPRPLLVLHGSEDDRVPLFDARVIGDAHGDAELRIIQGAGHQLRHDPRAVAVLLGWLDRQKHRPES